VVTIPLARAAASAPKASGSGTFRTQNDVLYDRVFRISFQRCLSWVFLGNVFSSVIYFLNILVSRFGKLGEERTRGKGKKNGRIFFTSCVFLR